jgi:uncharacterized protein YfaS (alpha-2-macroglobulin family)
MIRDHINLLKQINIDGGFTPWTSMTGWDQRYPTLSAFVLEFLLDAKQADFAVDDELINQICDYLSSFLNDPTSQSKSWYTPSALDSISTYATMVLAKAGREVSSYVEVFFEKKESLQVVDLINLIRTIGYLPQITGQSQMLQDTIALLQNNFTVSAGQTQITNFSYSPWTWTDGDKLTAMALLALCQTAPTNEFIPGLVRNLALIAKKGNYTTTQSNVYALMALSQYIDQTEVDHPNLSITALLQDKEFLKATFTSHNNVPVTAKENISNLPEVKTLNINSDGKGTAWATVKLTTAQLEADFSSDIAGGLILSRSYEVIRPKESNPSQSTFQRGQVVKVTVTMMTPDNRHDLVLEDKIPAGFETINLNFLSEDQTLNLHTNPESTGWKYQDNFWFYHQEIWPDRVSVFTDFIPAGVYTYSYLVRPVTIGVYQVPGPKAEEMYSPETYGRGHGQTLTIVQAE